MNNIVKNRHDVLVLFEVQNGNPNGNPDAGNMPRIDPMTNKGIVTDVCLKRKIRNFIEILNPDSDGVNGYSILVRQGGVINNEIDDAEHEIIVEKNAEDDVKAEATVKRLCQKFYDVRTFGAVVSTGKKGSVMNGSSYGQIRGPVQMTFAQSYQPIIPLDITITRCAVTKEEDKKKERTMGNKHIVPYALYAAKIYVSPPFAEKTGFTDRDLSIFFDALREMFHHDRSSARGEMIIRGIYDFEHLGTQHPNNQEQNHREARLGCYHSHKLFEGIKVHLKSGKEYPESIQDYEIICDWDDVNLPKGIKLNKRHL